VPNYNFAATAQLVGNGCDSLVPSHLSFLNQTFFFFFAASATARRQPPAAVRQSEAGIMEPLPLAPLPKLYIPDGRILARDNSSLDAANGSTVTGGVWHPR
jgi:hypothetical protein